MFSAASSSKHDVDLYWLVCIPFDPTISSVVLPCAHERDLGLLVDGRLLRVHDGARDTEVNAAPEYIYLQ